MEIKQINTKASINKELPFEQVILKLLKVVNTVMEVDKEMISFDNRINALGINSKIEASRSTIGADKNVKMSEKASVFGVISSKIEEQYKAMSKSNLKLKKDLEYLVVCETDINNSLVELFVLDFDPSLKEQIPLLLKEIKLEFNNIVLFNQSIRLILSKIEFLSLNMNVSSNKLKNGISVDDATFKNFADELKEISEAIQNSTGKMDEETKKIKELINKVLQIISVIKPTLEIKEDTKQKKLITKL